MGTFLRFNLLLFFCFVRALGRRMIGRRLRPGWTIMTETVFTALKMDLGRALRERPLEELRQDLSAPRGMALLSRRVIIEAVEVEGLSAGWFVPPKALEEGVLVFLHGGGFVAGSWRSTDREVIAALALESGLKTLAVDYRLAPEHPFPAALEDVRTALNWLRSQSYESGKIVLAGDSAGGNLALAAMIDARDRGEELPGAAALLSPLVDLRCQSESFKTEQEWDFLPGAFVRWGAKCYAGEEDLEKPLLSPLLADLRDLPPIIIQVGGSEIFRDQGQALGEALREAGNDVTFELWPDMVHVWQLLSPVIPEAKRACEGLGQYLRAAVLKD